MDIRHAPTETRDLVFRKIGDDISLTLESPAFIDSIPARALAVSNRFGLTFFVHAKGFAVAKTSKLVELAKQSKNDRGNRTAEKESELVISVRNVRSLSLSRDELTLAVCVGDRAVEFYDVPSLVHKFDKSPFETKDIPDGDVKDLSWSPADEGVYFVLSHEGQLFRGGVGVDYEQLVESKVEAACWSPDGKHIAYSTDDRSLHIATSSLENEFSVDLPADLHEDEDDPSLKVESINWVRPDSILVSYIHINEDAEEDDCPLLLLRSKNGDLAQEDGVLEGMIFENLFPSTDSVVIPTGSGPYMLTQYVDPWKIAVAANRRSVDDHIVIIGWSFEGAQLEAYNIELSNDAWIPRIELQESGDDNVLLGLAFDFTTTNLQLTDPRDDSGDTKLPPCPVLLCLSLGGKLSLFSVARLDQNGMDTELVFPPSAVPSSKLKAPPSKPSVELATKPLKLEPASKALTDTVQTAKSETDDRGDDETSVYSGSGTDEDDHDGSEDDEASQNISPAGRPGELKPVRAQIKSLSDEKIDKVDEKPSTVSQQGANTSTASNSMTTKPSNASAISTVKSAPSGLDQIQPTVSTPQQPTLLTKSFSGSVVQVPPSTTIQKSSAAWTPGQRPAQAPAPGLFGHAGSEKGNRAHMPSTATSFSQQFPQLDRGSQTGFTKTSSTGVKSATTTTAPPVMVTPAPPVTVTPAPPVTVTPAQQSGGTEMEAFILELEKVKQMADEVDSLMAYIEGRSQKSIRNTPPSFTKQSLDELEFGIRNLVESCKNVKESVEEQRQGIENLRDECLRVDAWRIYVQSLAGQATDTRHQELWSRRKLPPDLDVKRKRVIKAEQVLKQQIAELEEHVHYLELSRRKSHATSRGGKTNSDRQESLGRGQSLQNLYNTVNGLLASADHLAQEVAQQMEALNISTQPATASKILKSVGISPDESRKFQIQSFSSGAIPSPRARHRLSYSPSSRLDSGTAGLATPPRRPVPSDSAVGAPSPARRRRDSMDMVRAMAGAASPKTTIERVTHVKPVQQASSLAVKHGHLRPFQDSTDESAAHPRHVRRVLSSQTGSVVSSSTSTSSSSDYKANFTSGNMFNVGATSSQKSFLPTSLQTQQPEEGRPESKRIVSRGPLSFGDTAPTFPASRFGPPPASTTAASVPNTTSSTPLSSIPNSESVFKWVSNVSPTSASSFSFVSTPSEPKVSGPPDKPGASLAIQTAASSGSQPSSVGIFSSTVSGSSGSLNTVNIESTQTVGNQATGKSGNEGFPKINVDNNLKPGFGTGKLDKSNLGAKIALSKASSFSKPMPLGGGGSLPLYSSPEGVATSVSIAAPSAFTLNLSGNKLSGFKEVDTKSQFNDEKLPLPLTPPVQLQFNKPATNSGSFHNSSSAAFFPVKPTTTATPLSAEKPQASLPQMVATVAAAPTITQVSQISSSLSTPVSSQQGPLSSPAAVQNLGPPASLPPTPTTQFIFPASNTPVQAPLFASVSMQPSDPDEEDMEEEPTGSGVFSGFGSLGGLGLGSTPSPAEAQKSSPFGSSSAFMPQQPSSMFPPLSAPQGQLFRPAAFSLPSAQSSPQSSGASTFGSGMSPQQGQASSFGIGFGAATSNPPGGNLFSTSSAAPGTGFATPMQPGIGGFGQPSQLGPGQQALGSALGAFGQTRQMGAGLSSPFGGGVGTAVSSGGFASAATGGGFASAATGGGFASAATGGGFAGAASASGFGSAPSGFAGVAGGGGFQAFGGNQSAGGGFGAFAGGGVSGFGGTPTPPAPTPLFTQMRK